MDTRSASEILTAFLLGDSRGPDLDGPPATPAAGVTVHTAHLEVATLNVAVSPPSNALQTPNDDASPPRNPLTHNAIPPHSPSSRLSHIVCRTTAVERAESPRRMKSFFASFCSQKEGLP
jgi:hypothetical protein